MFFLTWGRRFYGKIDSLGGAFVVTRFSHLQLLPFIPRASFLIVMNGTERALTLPLVGRSVLAGYARIWPFVAAFVGLILTNEVSPFLGVPVMLAALGVLIWAWARVGRLSAEERKQREVYAAFAGAPVDVALIARATRGVDAVDAQTWLEEVTRRAEEAMQGEGTNLAAKYRELARHTVWEQVAEQAVAATLPCKQAALTLTRLATEQGDAGARERATAAHARIWSAMRAS